MAQNISMARRQRHAEEMEKAIYAAPALMQDGAQLEYYLKYLANHPGAQRGRLTRRSGAPSVDVPFAADREAEAIAKHEKRQRSQARAAAPAAARSATQDAATQEADVSPEKPTGSATSLPSSSFMAMGGYAKR
jgi:hypothetical protein